MSEVNPASPHTILIVSGGSGASGEQIVNTVLAQFPESHVQVIRLSNVRFESQIEGAVAAAATAQATLVHTLVDAHLRAYLVSLARQNDVKEIDLMGSLLEHLASILEQQPVEQPGLYRRLNKAYFDRVGAIDYTISHDDGQNADTWNEAEIILVGLSRSGKTPLSLYLSVLGWKVANVPLVPGLELSPQLFEIDRQHVIGLKIEPAQLLAFRQQRQQRLGVSGPSDYTNPQKIFDELEYAIKIFRRCGFTVIDVTDKPVETSADEIIRLIQSRTKVA